MNISAGETTLDRLSKEWGEKKATSSEEWTYCIPNPKTDFDDVRRFIGLSFCGTEDVDGESLSRYLSSPFPSEIVRNNVNFYSLLLGFPIHETWINQNGLVVALKGRKKMQQQKTEKEEKEEQGTTTTTTKLSNNDNKNNDNNNNDDDELVAAIILREYDPIKEEERKKSIFSKIWFLQMTF